METVWWSHSWVDKDGEGPRWSLELPVQVDGEVQTRARRTGL